MRMAESKPREVKMGRGARGMGPRPRLENPGKIFKRLIAISFGHYKLRIVFVVIGIITSVLCTVRGTLFMKELVDVYILPLIGSKDPDFIHAGKKIPILPLYGFHDQNRYSHAVKIRGHLLQKCAFSTSGLSKHSCMKQELLYWYVDILQRMHTLS